MAEEQSIGDRVRAAYYATLNFAYHNGPKPLRDWMERRALQQEADEQYAAYEKRVAAGFYVEPQVREGRDEEILRRYSESIRDQQTYVPPVIEKPNDLEGHRQEQAFYRKHAERSSEPREVEDLNFVGPRTDRGWVAFNLERAAESRREGNFDEARYHVESARQDRTVYQQPDLGLSR